MAFTTRKSIVAKVCAGDEVSWDEFYNSYRSLVWLRGSDYNLNESEQEELLQQVMLSFFKQSRKFIYNPQKGKFRNYLKTIISHEALRIKKKRAKTDQPMEAEVINHLAKSDSSMEREWEKEWRSFIFSQALEELKETIDSTHFQAFEMYAIQGGKAQEVASFLDISVNSVYVIKNRAVKQLREIIDKLNISEKV